MVTADGYAGLPPLSFERGCDGSGRLRLTVTGEIDFSNSDDLLATVAGVLDEPGVSWVEVDLGPLRFLDSSGAQSLVRCQRLAQSRRVEFVVSNAHGMVRRVLEVLGIDKVLRGGP